MNPRELPFCIVDIETTGLDPRYHEIIDIGVVLCRQDSFEIIAEYGQRVLPLHIDRMQPAAQKLNGYTPELWANAISLKEAMRTFAPFLKKSIFTSQNPTFDWPFVRDAISNYGFGLEWEEDWFYHRLDIWSVAMGLYRHTGLPRMNQDWLQSYLNVDPEPEPHTALEGARLSYRILNAMLGTRILFQHPDPVFQ